MSDYKSLVEQYYPVACEKFWAMMQQALTENLKWEEEEHKNFVLELYDFSIQPERVGGAFIKRAKEVKISQGDRFLKIVPAGMAWIGIYGKLEFLSNAQQSENCLLKHGIWFCYQNEEVIPVYPEKDVNGEYPPLTLEHLKELLQEIFSNR